MNLAELLKLKIAAKTYLGGLALAAQVALTFLPDQSGYYHDVQILLALLGLIGIYAVPNKKVADVNQSTASIADQIQALLLQFKTLVPAALPTDAPIVQAAVEQAKQTSVEATTITPSAHVQFVAPLGVSAPLDEAPTDVKPEGLPFATGGAVLPLGNLDGVKVLREAAATADAPTAAPVTPAPEAAPAPAETPATPPVGAP